MSEPRYIQRDGNGKVLGHFANEQSYAKECVPDDHPDILACEEKKMATKAAYMECKARLDPEKLLARIAQLEAQMKELKRG